MMSYRKILLNYIYIISALIVIEASFIVLVSPYFLIRYISIDSDIPFSKDEIISLSGIKPNTYYYNANIIQYEENLQRDLRIQSAELSLKFPNKISIRIKKREPIVVFLQNIDGEIMYYMLSSDGIILEKNKNLTYNLPIVSGLKIKNSQIGDFVDERIINVLKNLKDLKANNVNLYNLVSEINFLKLNFYDYKITLSLKNIYNKILITVDMNLFDVIRKVFMVSDLIKNKNYLIDLRSNDIILIGESGV